MGLGAGTSGSVTVVDMDHIEYSNLSRQFLFRPWDIGVSASPSFTYILDCPPVMPLYQTSFSLFFQKSKAEVAAAATQDLNPDLEVTAYTRILDHTTEDIYADNFFSHVDGVVAAVDTFKARECLTQLSTYPSLCQSHSEPLPSCQGTTCLLAASTT